MTSPQRRAEASKASLVFHAAIIQLGYEATLDALDAWADVQPVPARLAETAGRFIAQMIEALGISRAEARSLALLYIQYHRALLTGYTLSTSQEATSADLTGLRDEFYSQVEELTPGLLDDDWSLVDDDGVLEAEAPEDLDDPVEVEDVELPTEGELEELDEQAAEEFEGQVLNSSVRGIVNKQPKASTEAGKADAQREKAHSEAGSIAAGAFQRGVINGAREVIERVALKDKRVIAFARLSATGTPCGFCAMLISRGAVYKSARTAGQDNAYHRDCNCVAVAVYSDEQYDEDPAFDLNRELSEDWGRETRGLRGKAALAAFRKFMKKRNAALAAA